MNACISIAAPCLGHCAVSHTGASPAHARHQQMISGFMPSTNTFNFSARYWNTVADWGHDSECGVAGGLLYATLDYFNAGFLTGDGMETPARPDSPLHRYILHRGRASYRDLLGAYQLLENAAPMHQSWARIRSEIDNGRPALIALGASDALQMRHIKQVLVYGYLLADRKATLYLYDPDFPQRDDVTLELDLCRCSGATEMVSGEAVPGFIHALFILNGYRPESPGACCADISTRYSIAL